MIIKNLIKIISVFSLFLISCRDENQNKTNYKKKTDMSLTRQSIDKKLSTFY